MATSVVTPVVVERFDTGKVILVFGVLGVAAGDYATGGLSISTLVGLADMGGNANPLMVFITGKSGYVFEYDKTNVKMIVRQNKNPADAGGADIPLPELAAAASPAALVADTIEFVAFLAKFRSA